MRLAWLAGVASLCVVGATGAQAETIYTTTGPAVVADPNVIVTQPNVVVTTPGQVVAVPAPPFGPFTPQYIVTQPSVVAAPPAATTTTTVAAPRERVIERERIVEPRRNARGKIAGQRVIERERVVVEQPREQVVTTSPSQVVVEPREPAIVTTGSSTSRCFIDLRGIERCY